MKVLLFQSDLILNFHPTVYNKKKKIFLIFFSQSQPVCFDKWKNPKCLFLVPTQNNKVNTVKDVGESAEAVCNSKLEGVCVWA